MNFKDEITQIIARYERLSDREQILVIITAAVVLLVVYLSLVLLPVVESRSTAIERYQSEVEVSQQLKLIKPVQTSVSNGNQSSLLAVVNDSAIELGIDLKRVEPKGSENLRVWIDAVSFNQVVNWLGKLRNTFGVNVISVTFDRTETNGVVNTAIVLQRT